MSAGDLAERFHRVSSLAQTAISGSSDGTMGQLDAELDALGDKLRGDSAIAELYPEDMPLQQFLMSSVSCLAAVHPELRKIQFKIVKLLANIAYINPAIRVQLQCEYELIPVLYGHLLKSRHFTEVHYAQTLKLTQVVTYGIDESAMLPTPESDQLKALTGLALYSVDCLLPISEENERYLSYYLGILRNICIGCKHIRSHLWQQHKWRQVQKRLTGLISHSSVPVVIGALSLLSTDDPSTCYKVLDKKSLPNAFACMFNIILRGDDLLARANACDLFLSMCSDEVFGEALLQYEHVNDSLRQVAEKLCLLKDRKNQVLKIYDLLISLYKLEKWPQKLNLVFTLPNSTAALSAVTSSQIFIALFSTASSLTTKHNALLVSRRALELLYHIISNNPSDGLVQSMARNEELLTLVENGLRVSIETGSPTALGNSEYILWCLRLLTALTEVGLHDDVMRLMTPPITAHLAGFQLDSNFGATPAESAGTWRHHGIGILLEVLHILKILGPSSQPHMNHYYRLAKDERFTDFLAYGLCCGDSFLLQRCLLHLSDLTRELSVSLLAKLATIIAERNIAFQRSFRGIRSTSAGSPVFLTAGTSTPMGRGDGWFAGSIGSSYGSFDASRLPNSLNSPNNHAELDNLINKMKSDMNLNVNEDITTAQMMDIYELKIKSLQAKEKELSDMLKLQAAAVQKGELLRTQYRGGSKEQDLELAQMRAMFQENERKCERMKKDLESMISDLKTKENELMELSESRNSAKDRIEQLQSVIETKEKEIAQEKEMSATVRQHYDKVRQDFTETSQRLITMSEENKTIKKQIKHEEKECAKWRQISEKLETDMANKERESAEMERNCDQLQSTLQSLESEKRNLRKQVESMQVEQKAKEALISRLQHDKTDLEKELKEAKQVTEMIRKLASKEKEAR